MSTKRKLIPYNPKLKLLARRLRSKSTKAEILLWQYLKGKQMEGYDFHRQRPINSYIVDFFCSELMLAIEIDGISHDQKMEADRIRQKRLESFGVKILRFLDDDVKENLEGVVMRIKEWIEEYVSDLSRDENKREEYD